MNRTALRLTTALALAGMFACGPSEVDDGGGGGNGSGGSGGSGTSGSGGSTPTPTGGTSGVAGNTGTGGTTPSTGGGSSGSGTGGSGPSAAGPRCRIDNTMVAAKDLLVASFEEGEAVTNAPAGQTWDGSMGAGYDMSVAGSTQNFEIAAGTGCQGSRFFAHVWGVDAAAATDVVKYAPSAGLTFYAGMDQAGNWVTKPADISAYQGVSFWVRTASSSAQKVRVTLSTKEVIPTMAGGTCTTGCYNAYGKDLLLAPDDWTKITLNFTELKQAAGWGTKVDWNPAAVMGISWNFDKGKSYDLWVDDVVLIAK